MQITFDFDLDAGEAQLLAATLGCQPDELQDRLGLHARAALAEYVECYLGRRAFTGGGDILSHRLALLMRFVFGGSIPSAGQVATLFQITPSRAGTLVRNALSRYRYELDAIAADAAAGALRDAVPAGDDRYHIRSTSPDVVDLMNRRLLASNPGLTGVRRTQGAVGTYVVTADALDVLKTAFGVVDGGAAA